MGRCLIKRWHVERTSSAATFRESVFFWGSCLMMSYRTPNSKHSIGTLFDIVLCLLVRQLKLVVFCRSFVVLPNDRQRGDWNLLSPPKIDSPSGLLAIREQLDSSHPLLESHHYETSVFPVCYNFIV